MQDVNIQELRRAIPDYCFKASTARSLAYVARDLFLAGSLAYLALYTIPTYTTSSSLPRFLAWQLYGFCQGLVGTGIWILAHECGHGAFSASTRLNNVVGWALHSSLLVPFFSWKFTHHQHHQFTGHMTKDTAFVPVREEEPISDLAAAMESLENMTEDAPIVAFLRLIVAQTLGWPLYLIFQITAGKGSDIHKGNRKTTWYNRSHFAPGGVLFTSQQWKYIFASDVGLGLTMAALWVLKQRMGWAMVWNLYGLPYMWVHHWLVAITYLHHTHADLPHFEADGWTFARGATSTVDRDMGFIDRHLFHGIIGTHVCHHLFPRIPFYYAEDATAAIVPVLGAAYHKDSTPFMLSLWRTFTTCRWVTPVTMPDGQGTMRVWTTRRATPAVGAKPKPSAAGISNLKKRRESMTASAQTVRPVVI
ncbi:uncharacterized protein BDZ99DRAFT_462473, partial [Mytilinidion resinicola]